MIMNWITTLRTQVSMQLQSFINHCILSAPPPPPPPTFKKSIAKYYFYLIQHENTSFDVAALIPQSKALGGHRSYLWYS